jgi:hypothetical protein
LGTTVRCRLAMSRWCLRYILQQLFVSHLLGFTVACGFVTVLQVNHLIGQKGNRKCTWPGPFLTTQTKNDPMVLQATRLDIHEMFEELGLAE